jgi:dihydroorotase
MSEFEYDLLIRAGRIVCTQTNLDGPGAVAIRGDRIVASGGKIDGTSRQTLEFPNALLLPGLIDLHAHPAKNGSKYGVDPDLEFLPRGVTTVLSQGDAGAENWSAYRRQTIDESRTRVRLAINLSKMGEPEGGPCLRDIDWIDVDACCHAVIAGGDHIWGIAVNASRDGCLLDPKHVVRSALQVAERTGKPLLYGMRNPPDWPIAAQLELLRTGDVVTYLFRDGEWSIVDDQGQVLPEIRKARERGVLFDACHGMKSFSFRVAEAALADGFYPDTISTDQYASHVGSEPQHDLPRTMSKFLAAGMPEYEVFARVGARPAKILGLSDEVGTLSPGACADLTVLAHNDAAAALVDCYKRQRAGGCWETSLVVRGGQVQITSSGSTSRS